MAQTSLTVPVSKLYDVLLSGSDYSWYYRDLTQSSLILNDPYGIDSDSSYLYFGLPDLTATLGRHIIYSIAPKFRIVAPYDRAGLTMLSCVRLNEELPDLSPGSQYIPAPKYDSNKPRGPYYYVASTSPIPEPGSDVVVDFYSSEIGAGEKSEFAYSVLKLRAGALRSSVGDPKIKVYSTLLNGNAPSVTIYYDDTDLVSRSISSVSGITSGYWNPRLDQQIGWILSVDKSNIYSSLDTNIIPVHETISWRLSGDTSWTDITIPDGASSYTVPAGTFPIGESIEWRLSVTDQDGVTSVSNVFTVTTDDSESTATPASPVNSVETGNKVIRFKWTVTNPSGAPPSRVKAEWATSPNAEEWTELFDESSAIYSFDADPNTFPGGNIYWKITSYNCDSEAGPTSDPAVFTCIAPPTPPTNVQATSAPFSTISWQSVLQSAYEILVDGTSVTKRFGSDVYSYTLDEPLPDGEHTIGVRLQGPFGYWSDVTNTVIITENQGTGTLAIEGRFRTDASLSWLASDMGDILAYRVYRDGKLIARTNHSYFLDRFVLGQHHYYVLAEMAAGHYVKSSDIVGTLKSCITQIAEAAGGEWLKLELSENSNSVQTFEWNQTISLRHYAGAAYPVAEFSPFEDRLASYDCAFKTVEEAKAFEALRGKIVIVKSRGGEVTIGPLSVIGKTTGDFYVAYRFSVQQIHWEDFINDTVD